MNVLGHSLAVALASVILMPRPVSAQTRQPVSLHLSAVTTQFNTDEGTSSRGVGGEAQLRYTAGRFSFAVGGQYTTHDVGGQSFQIGGALIEPRVLLDLGLDAFAPYLALRGAVTQVMNSPDGVSTIGREYGGGGGFIVVLGSRVNLDVGAALTRASYATDVSGFSSRFTATNVVAKAGFSIGIGSSRGDGAK
jgi:hypothetical protein